MRHTCASSTNVRHNCIMMLNTSDHVFAPSSCLVIKIVTFAVRWAELDGQIPRSSSYLISYVYCSRCFVLTDVVYAKTRYWVTNHVWLSLDDVCFDFNIDLVLGNGFKILGKLILLVLPKETSQLNINNDCIVSKG